MKLFLRNRRWVVTLMLGVITAALVAPAAEAGNAYGHYRRWKPGPRRYVSYSYVRPAPVRVGYYEHSSGAAPFIAGLIGGAILGTALSQSHATVSTGYYDPYCDITFSSLDACRSHFRHYDHPEVIRVVEGGHFTRDLCWSGGGWRDYHGSWGRGDRDGWNGRDGGRWNDDRGDTRSRDDGRWNDDRGDSRYRDDGGSNDRGDDSRWNDRDDDGGNRR